MSFDPQPHLIQLPKRVKNPETGKWETKQEDYLEVKWRLCWFRDRYPHGRIETEEVCVDLDRVMRVEVTTTVDGKRQTQTKTGTGYARFKARVEDGEGGVATGYGTENAAEFTDFCERAETRAVGRGLAGLGIGTQFVGAELSEGEHIVDSPVGGTTDQAGQKIVTNGHTPAHEPDVSLAHPTEAHIAALATLALTECHEDQEVYEQRIRQTMGLKPAASVAPRLLTRTMSMTQYMKLFAYYRRLEAQLVKSRKDVSDGPTSQDASAPTATPAPTAPEPPASPQPEVSPAAAATEAGSSRGIPPAPDPGDTVEALVADAIAWGLKEDVTRRVIHLHKDLVKCRRILAEAAERNRRQVA